MIICDICGKELKNSQGLRGHRTFVHGQSTKKNVGVITEEPVSKLELTPSNAELTPEEPASKLEDRLQELEQVTGLRGYNFLKRPKGGLPLTLQLAGATRQMNEQAELLKTWLLEHTEQVNQLSERVEQLALTVEAQETELYRVSELTGKLRVDYDDFKHNSSKLLPLAENKLSAVTSDLDLLFQALGCHTHSNDKTCLLPSAEAVKSFSDRLNIANERRGKLPIVVAKYNDQFFYKDKPDDGKQYVLYKGVGWTADNQRRN